MTFRLVALLLVGVACAASCRQRDDARAQQSVAPSLAPKTPPFPSTFVVLPNGDSVTVNVPAPEPRWGRADGSSPTGDHRLTVSNWEPTEWELLPVADVQSIPNALRLPLAQLDCVVPRYRPTTREASVIFGEFERAGQRDIAVLCVHADRSSSVYVFWNGEPELREAMPGSGTGISAVLQPDVEAAADKTRPLEADMPPAAMHDGIAIGCCDLGQTIFYRHEGKWFTLRQGD